MRWTFPLVDALPGGQRTIDGDDLPSTVWATHESSPLTEQLAAAGVAVVCAYRRDSIASAFALHQRTAREVSLELTVVAPVEATDEDVALLALVEELLDHVHRKPAGVRFVELIGARSDLFATALPSVDARVLARDDAGRSPFALIAEINKPNVGLLLDSWHWYTAQETVADLMTCSAKEIISVDLNDAPAGLPVEQQKDNMRELPCATGVIPVADFLNALNKLGCDAPVRCEPFNAPLRAMAPEDALKTTAAAMKKAFALIV